MQENEFEKQAKATLEEFRLRPSGPVWPGIREEIKDKKRRRILLLIPAFMVLLGLGYFIWQSFLEPGKMQSSEKELLLNADTKSKDIHTKNQRPGQTDAIKPEKDSMVTEKLGDRNAVTPVKNEILNNDNNITAKKLSGSNIAHTINKKNSHGASGKGNNKIFAQETQELFAPARKLDINNNLKDVQQRQHQVDSADVDIEGAKKLQPDNLPVMIENYFPLSVTTNSITAGRLVLKGITPVNSEQDLKRIGKVKWGIDFSIGGSSRIERPFKVASLEESNTYAGGGVNNPVGGVTTGAVAGGLLVLPPSNVKPGTGFKIGFVVDKSISKRVDISTGLRYVYGSDRISIGKTIYSTGNLALQDRNYSPVAVAQTSSSSTQPQNYTNKYHFVELPVTVYVNLTKKWKTPVIWNAGASLSRLISSNVLLYDETWGGLYYQDNNDLSKTQFSAATGFSIRFKGSNQWQWNIGPQVSMNTTKLFHSAYDKNKHIVYGGIHLQLLLPGEKK